MDDWQKFNETLTEKEDFYSHLNVEDHTDADYAHAKTVCKDFEKKIQEIRADLKICWFAVTWICFFKYTQLVGKKKLLLFFDGKDSINPYLLVSIF